MKKFTTFVSILLTVVIFLMSVPVTLAVAEVTFAGGSGSSVDPFKVSTPAQLNAVKLNLDKCFIQINDIDMTVSTAINGAYYNGGKGWEPIWDFSGTYDGGGYAIKGLKINRTNNDAIYLGLFAFNSGTIKNLGLENGDIRGATNYSSSSPSISALSATGGIAAYNSGTISNCYNVSTAVTATNASYYVIDQVYVGGIAGQNYGTIINCSNSGVITGSDYVSATVYAGGITGFLGSGIISSCSNLSNVNTSGSYNTRYTGGIVGYMDSGLISNCYNQGYISASTSQGNTIIYGGGITCRSKVNGGGMILNCYSTNDDIIYSNGGVVTSCYYLSTSGHDDGKNGTEPMTVAQMKDNSFVELLNQISGTEVWCMDNSNANAGYPVFTYQSTVTSNVPHGLYAAPQMVTLTVAAPNAQIYYTLDGSNPKTNGILYGGSIPIKSTLTLKAAAKTDGTWSSVSQYNYIISSAAGKPSSESYTINRMFFTNSEGDIINPGETKGFVCNVEIKKNLERSQNDYVIIAVYDVNNELIDFSYMRPHMTKGEMYEMGVLIGIPNGKVLGRVKSFVWEGFSGITNLSEVFVHEVI